MAEEIAISRSVYKKLAAMAGEPAVAMRAWTGEVWGPTDAPASLVLNALEAVPFLNAAGVGRLDRGDRATGKEPARRYQRDTPGELIHVDIKKLSGIPDGGGGRTRGRGYAGDGVRSRQVGYRYIHTAIGDRTRIAYSEILTNEQAGTAAGFWKLCYPVVRGRAGLDSMCEETRVHMFRRAMAHDADLLDEMTLAGVRHWGHHENHPEAYAGLADQLQAEDGPENHPVFVLEKDGEVVAFYGLRDRGDHVELLRMFMRSDLIGQGYGRMLWNHAVVQAAQLRTAHRTVMYS